MLREQNVTMLRGLLNHELPLEVRKALPASIKVLQDDIVKVASTLRTTLAIQSIALIEELACVLKDDLGTTADLFFNGMLRMAGFTKRIVAQASQTAAAALIRCLSYRHCFLSGLQQSITEKNTQTRIAACQHLVVLLKAHGSDTHRFTAHHGVCEAVATVLQKGLSDQNKDARQFSREAYWIYHDLWPNESGPLLERLDAAIKRQVLADAPSESAAKQLEPQVKPVAAIPARKPGGPSKALLAAKRAASQRLQAQAEAEARAAQMQDPEPPTEREEEEELLQEESAPKHARGMSESPEPELSEPKEVQSKGLAAPSHEKEEIASPKPEANGAALASAIPPGHSRRDRDAFLNRADRLEGGAGKEADMASEAELEPVSSWVQPIESRSCDLRFFRRLAKWASQTGSTSRRHPLEQDPAQAPRLVQALQDFILQKQEVSWTWIVQQGRSLTHLLSSPLTKLWQLWWCFTGSPSNTLNLCKSRARMKTCLIYCSTLSFLEIAPCKMLARRLPSRGHPTSNLRWEFGHCRRGVLSAFRSIKSGARSHKRSSLFFSLMRFY